MIDLSALAPFLFAVVLLNILPGPDMFLLVSRSVSQGWRASFFTAPGFAVAGVIQIPILMFGLASIIKSSGLIFDVLRYTGAAYLFVRGIRCIRDSATLSVSLPTQ